MGSDLHIDGTEVPYVELFPVAAEHADLLSAWVSHDEARPWLDLGGGRQELPTRQLYMMLTGPRTHTRLFRLPGEDRPRGLVALLNANDAMGGAELWTVRDLTIPRPRRGLVEGAILRLFATAFLELDRHVIGAWIVETNARSHKLTDGVGMRRCGVQRARHVIDGQRLDRVLYDITRDEFAQAWPTVPSENGHRFADPT